MVKKPSLRPVICVSYVYVFSFQMQWLSSKTTNPLFSFCCWCNNLARQKKGKACACLRMLKHVWKRKAFKMTCGMIREKTCPGGRLQHGQEVEGARISQAVKRRWMEADFSEYCEVGPQKAVILCEMGCRLRKLAKDGVDAINWCMLKVDRTGT